MKTIKTKTGYKAGPNGKVLRGKGAKKRAQRLVKAINARK